MLSSCVWLVVEVFSCCGLYIMFSLHRSLRTCVQMPADSCWYIRELGDINVFHPRRRGGKRWRKTGRYLWQPGPDSWASRALGRWLCKKIGIQEHSTRSVWPVRLTVRTEEPIKANNSWTWWHMTVIPAFKRLAECPGPGWSEPHSEFEAILG